MFAYNPQRQILKSLSFEVPAGKKTAIVGPSGCGKSTVVRLLGRFYDPASGRIYIDGQDIADVQIQSLRAALGVVPQDTPLFHTDIITNVRYGRLEASDEDVFEAARKANIHDAVVKLPEGYKTAVGERGLMISGGEKQRLAIARVLLKNPPILLFDEAVRIILHEEAVADTFPPQTSALDPHTEHDLMQNVNAILHERQCTSVFIAHRLRTIIDAGEFAQAHARPCLVLTQARAQI